MLFAQVVLIMLHGPGGHQIMLNPQEVTSLTAAVPDRNNKLLVLDVNCKINTTDGKFIAVVETCEEVKWLISGK